MEHVLVAREVPGLDATPVVRGDDAVGMELAVRHLVEAGHRRIAFVGGSGRSSAGRERRRGYEMALEAAGIAIEPELQFPDLMTRADGKRVAAEVIARRPTAIACFNDLVALGIMTEMVRRGIEPGADIALAGYDDIEEARISAPALTSVWNGQQAVGSRAAQMLSDLIAGNRVEENRVLVAPELRIRETTTPRLRMSA